MSGRKWFALNKRLYYPRFNSDVIEKILNNDIKCIIISNGNGNYRIVKTPYVIVIGGEQDEILRYCTDSPKRHVLTGNDIRYYLSEKIGFYYPDNMWKIFKKGSSVINNYLFVWNEREMHKIFKGYLGDYYIAASVLENYDDEFADIVKKYNISSEQIKVIDDSIKGKFIWNL